MSRLSLAALFAVAALGCSTAPDPKPAPKPTTGAAAQPATADGPVCEPCRVTLCVDRSNKVSRIDVDLTVRTPNPRVRFDEATLQLSGKSGSTQVVPLDTRNWKAGTAHRQIIKAPKLDAARGGWKTEGSVTVSWAAAGKAQASRLVVEVEPKACK